MAGSWRASSLRRSTCGPLEPCSTRRAHTQTLCWGALGVLRSMLELQGCLDMQLRPCAQQKRKPPSHLHGITTFIIVQQPGVGLWQAARHDSCRTPAGARISPGAAALRRWVCRLVVLKRCV